MKRRKFIKIFSAITGLTSVKTTDDKKTETESTYKMEIYLPKTSYVKDGLTYYDKLDPKYQRKYHLYIDDLNPNRDFDKFTKHCDHCHECCNDHQKWSPIKLESGEIFDPEKKKCKHCGLEIWVECIGHHVCRH